MLTYPEQLETVINSAALPDCGETLEALPAHMVGCMCRMCRFYPAAALYAIRGAYGGDLETPICADDAAWFARQAGVRDDRPAATGALCPDCAGQQEESEAA